MHLTKKLLKTINIQLNKWYNYIHYVFKRIIYETGHPWVSVLALSFSINLFKKINSTIIEYINTLNTSGSVLNVVALSE